MQVYIVVNLKDLLSAIYLLTSQESFNASFPLRKKNTSRDKFIRIIFDEVYHGKNYDFLRGTI